MSNRTVPRDSHVSMKLYDASGRQVRDLIDRSVEAGFHRVTIHASGLSSGVYFCRMTADGFVSTTPLILVK